MQLSHDARTKSIETTITVAEGAERLRAKINGEVTKLSKNTLVILMLESD